MPSLAQRLRKNPSTAEVRLWRLIEPLRTGQYHFRKQAPIGRYVADFACHRAKLVIEVDGDTHFVGMGPQRDDARTAFLTGEGYTILRFTNLDVLTNPDGVYASILAALATEPDHAR